MTTVLLPRAKGEAFQGPNVDDLRRLGLVDMMTEEESRLTSLAPVPGFWLKKKRGGWYENQAKEGKTLRKRQELLGGGAGSAMALELAGKGICGALDRWWSASRRLCGAGGLRLASEQGQLNTASSLSHLKNSVSPLYPSDLTAEGSKRHSHEVYVRQGPAPVHPHSLDRSDDHVIHSQGNVRP